MLNELKVGIYSQLSSGTALTSYLGGTFIYDTIAPPNAPGPPYVVYQLLGGGDENDTPIDTTNTVWLVKCIARSQKFAGSAADLIRDIMHGTALTVSGWKNFWTSHETVVFYHEEAEGGYVLFHAGGQYRIRACKE